MSDNGNLRIWQLLVGVLAVCNVVLLATMFLRPCGHGRPPMGGPQEGGPRNFMVETLRFSDAQTKSFDALVQLHRDSMKYFREEGRVLRKAMFDGLKDGVAPPAEMAAKIAANQEKVELMTYRHFLAVRALCNADQQKAFADCIEEVLHMMTAGEQNGPPPPGMGGHRPPPGQ